MPQVAFGGREIRIAVFEQGHPQIRRLSVLFRMGKLLDNGPELALGLFDQAVHGVGGIQEYCYVHGGLPGWCDADNRGLDS